MKIYWLSFFVILIVAFSGCKDDNAVSTEEISKIWVAQFYSGGIQCDTSSYYQPPDVTEILEDEGVTVFETQVEGYAVCAACGCPSYAAMHYALIKEVDLEKAVELGFTQKDPS